MLWPTGDRELAIDLLDKLTGARVTHAYFVPGGIRNDFPANFEDVCIRQVNYLEKRLKEYAAIFYDNPILISRTKDAGILSRQDAIRLGTKEPYDAYEELDVHTNVLKKGDSYDRSKIPWLDMLESCNIIKQALEKMPKSGSVRVKLKPNPKGGNEEVYKRVESGRGALGVYIVSRSKPEPYRLKLSVGSFRNLICMPYLQQFIGVLTTGLWRQIDNVCYSSEI